MALPVLDHGRTLGRETPYVISVMYVIINSKVYMSNIRIKTHFFNITSLKNHRQEGSCDSGVKIILVWADNSE